MDEVILLGRDHLNLGQVEIRPIGPGATGISRGRHPKAYPYVDPNEDALVAIDGSGLWLCAVADGHNGVRASHAAVEAVHDATESLLALDPTAAVEHACDLAAAALASLPAPADETPPSATTFTAVAVRGTDGAAGGWGDSVAVRFRGNRSRLLTESRTDFRASGLPPGPVPVATSFRTRPGDVIVVASDGLADFLAPPWPKTLARLLAPLTDPLAQVHAAIEAAGDGGGGDNLAVGIITITSD